jgi:hypothetical protein
MNFFLILLVLLAGGIFSMLHQIPIEEIGEAFYRLVTNLYLIGMTIVFISVQPETGIGWLQFWLIFISLGTGFLHRLGLYRSASGLRILSYWSTVTGLVCLCVTIAVMDPLPGVMKGATTPLTNTLHLLVSAAIMGAIVDAMICGHWYLVNADLSLVPIRSISRALTLAIIVKIILVGWSLIQTKYFDPLLFRRVVFLLPILFWVRILVGLAGGLFFNWMSWKALEHGNTQAATGILYACITWIVLGEFSGFYLTITTGVPL